MLFNLGLNKCYIKTNKHEINEVGLFLIVFNFSPEKNNSKVYI